MVVAATDRTSASVSPSRRYTAHCCRLYEYVHVLCRPTCMAIGCVGSDRTDARAARKTSLSWEYAMAKQPCVSVQLSACLPLCMYIAPPRLTDVLLYSVLSCAGLWDNCGHMHALLANHANAGDLLPAVQTPLSCSRYTCRAKMC